MLCLYSIGSYFPPLPPSQDLDPSHPNPIPPSLLNSQNLPSSASKLAQVKGESSACLENGAKTDPEDDDDDHDDDDDDLECLKDEAGIDQIVADIKKKYKKQKSLIEFHSWEIIKKLKKPDNYVPVANTAQVPMKLHVNESQPLCCVD